MKWIPLQSVSYRSSLKVLLINKQLQMILELISEKKLYLLVHNYGK